MIEMRLLFLIGVVVWQATCSDAIIPLNRVIKSVNTFSSNLVKAIAEDASSNLVCSPVSADIVLSMAAFGARGHTKKVLRKVLDLSDDDSVTLNGYQSLVDDLQVSSGFELRMGNKIYLAEGFEPKNDFIDVVEIDFRSRTENINFGNPAEATKTINYWTESHTKNHIEDLVKENDFTNATALVLVSAVYFEASWKNNFREFNTEPRPFYVNGKNVENLETMWAFGVYRSDELPEVKAKFIELPYKSEYPLDSASMFIILPNEIGGIAELVTNLKKVTIGRLLYGTRRTINVYLPKFEIESTIDLKAPLTKLGLGEIFLDGADFTGIVDTPSLKVDKIVQKAFIEVNENGTAASAATQMEIMPRMWTSGVPYDPIDFKVDHPFVAVIATQDGLPLFISVIMKPTY